jgi:hypothetical protein
LAGIIAAVTAFSASADIVVPSGFVVDTLLEQIDGTIPRVEAIRNGDYGTGVVAASVDNGILTVLRVADSSIDLVASRPGYPLDAVVRTTRFDKTGLFGGELFLSINWSTGGLPECRERTELLRVSADGTTTQVGLVGDQDNPLALRFDFTAGLGGYIAGAYLEDTMLCSTDPGTSTYHMDVAYELTELAANLVPSGRTDLDVRGLEFDPTGAYGSYLTMADSDMDNDDVTVIYQLLPDLSWTEITTPVVTAERLYTDMSFSPGGSFGQTLYVAECRSSVVMTVDTNGDHSVFASGFDFRIDDQLTFGSITVSDDGECLFVSDANGVHRIRAITTTIGPALVMREPWPEGDDVHTGDSGVDSLRLLWNEPILFDEYDITVTNEDEGPVSFSVSGSNSQFMIIVFGEMLLQDTYTITVSDSVVSAETGVAIDGDNDGLAGGDAILVMTHRHPLDYDRDRDIDLSDLAELLGMYGTTWP